MRAIGVRCVDDYVVKACGHGDEAVEQVVEPSPLRDGLLASLRSESVDLSGILARAGREDLLAQVVRTAAVLNTPTLVAKAAADPRYRSGAIAPPRKIGSHLAVFDCINCDKCLPACPNDANFVYEARPEARDYQDYVVRSGRAEAAPGGRFSVREGHQIATFQDFCNDCGNCDTFCPEDGGPYIEKPRLFGTLEAWKRLADRDGFVVERRSATDTIWGRIRGIEYRLEVDRGADRATFSDGRLTLELKHASRAALSASAAPGTEEGHRLDVSAYLTMAAILDGVLDARRSNPVNAALA
jgi:putative selenate reductase